MGKRKKSRKPPPKKKKVPKLDTIFDCPFCGNEKCVETALDRTSGVGYVNCRICGADHSSKIHALEEAVDVYAAWIDETVKANEQGAAPELRDETRAKDPLNAADVEEDEGEERPRKQLRVGAVETDRHVDVGGLDDVDPEVEPGPS